MEILFGLVYLLIRLVYEEYQEHKANEYANMVVRRYEEKKK